MLWFRRAGNRGGQDLGAGKWEQILDVRINLAGRVDDLYALALLFPEGARPDVYVKTAIRGMKDGLGDRVADARQRETHMGGPGCLPLLDARTIGGTEWVARELLAPLNGYAVLADSNFQPVVPVSASYRGAGQEGHFTFGTNSPDEPTRLITVARHPSLVELRDVRVDFMIGDPLAAYAAAVIGARPSWADYYRILEDIAGRRGTTLDKLSQEGLAERTALDAFKKAANNRAFGRHGASKRDTSIPQDSLMNLLEAREFVRRVVSAWLDQEVGGRLPRDRVDGAQLRFGLDGGT